MLGQSPLHQHESGGHHHYGNNMGGGNGQISSELFNSQFITHRKASGVSQRKNTSDSNVKLLADHNFYHVTNTSRRYNGQNQPATQQHFNDSSTSIENTSSNNGYVFNNSSMNESTSVSCNGVGKFTCGGAAGNNGGGGGAAGGIVSQQSAKFKDMMKMAQKSYELSDYFKYNSKFKQRGLNSSSNSLISLNSSRLVFNLYIFLDKKPNKTISQTKN